MSRLSLALSGVLLGACASPPHLIDDVPATDEGSFEQSLFRDFRKNGKFDENGHPVNAVVVEAEKFCKGPGEVVEGGYRSGTEAAVVCQGRLPKLPGGEMILNVRLRPIGIDVGSLSDVVRVTVNAPAITTETYTGRSFRKDGQWSYVPVPFNSDSDADFSIETFGRGAVEIDYIEIFADEFPVAFTPGSRVFSDDDVVDIEGPLGALAPILTLDGHDMNLRDLVDRGKATFTTTSFRAVYSLRVGDLVGPRADDLDLFARAADAQEATARLHIYRSPPACEFVGDPAGKKVLLTGFHPFPVAEVHPNISSVAVFALDRAKLVGAQVMRLSIPVEYDDGPAIVVDAIARCSPDVVIDFGQGGAGIGLEHTAYNLKDTGRFADNRGRYQAGVPIDEDGPAELPSGLPIAAIKSALEAKIRTLELDTTVEESTDPGRYICNDTFYRAVRASQGKPIKAGFIHFPYTTLFDDATNAKWGEVVRTIVETAVAD